MLIRDKDKFMHNIKIRLNILEVWFAEAFQQNNGYLFTCIQVVRADNLNYLCSNIFIAIMNEFFNEVKVDKDDFFFFAQVNFINYVKFNETLDGFKKHTKIWIGIGASDSWTIDINF